MMPVVTVHDVIRAVAIMREHFVSSEGEHIPTDTYYVYAILSTAASESTKRYGLHMIVREDNGLVISIMADDPPDLEWDFLEEVQASTQTYTHPLHWGKRIERQYVPIQCGFREMIEDSLRVRSNSVVLYQQRKQAMVSHEVGITSGSIFGDVSPVGSGVSVLTPTDDDRPILQERTVLASDVIAIIPA